MVSEEVNFSGVRDIDQASPLRKRTFDAAATALELLPETNPAAALEDWEEICFPDSRTEGSEASSHCVSHSCLAKASLATIPRRISRLVFTLSI